MKKHSIYKKLALFLAVIMITTALFGCGKDKDNKKENDTVTEESASDNTQENVTDEENEDVNEEDGIVDDEQDVEADNTDETTEEKTEESDTSTGSDSNTSENNSGGSGSGSNSDSSGSGNSGSGAGGSAGNSGSTELSAGEKMAKQIVDSIITSGMSDFEKAITIHDWLTYNIDYDLTYTNYYLYETLRDRTGVCQGYAESFNSMAKFAGLDCVFIGGTADNGTSSGGHAWNRVKIDGSWYNVDTTWDDPVWDGKSPSDHTHNGYSYFLVSDATLNKDHVVGYIYGEAGAASKDYDRGAIYKYMYATGKCGDAVYLENKDAVLAEVFRQYEAGKNDIYVWCYSNWTEDELSKLMNDVLYGKYQLCTSIVYNESATNDLVKLRVVMSTPYSEWSAIPVATSNEEFNRICESQVAQGNRQVKVRFEPTDPNEVASLGDWLGNYGIMSVQSFATNYNQGIYMLFELTF